MSHAEAIHADVNRSAIGKQVEVAAFAKATLEKIRGDLTGLATSARVVLRKRAEQLDDQRRGDSVNKLRRREIRDILTRHHDRGAVIKKAIAAGHVETLAAIAYAPTILGLAHPSTIELAHRKLWEVTDATKFGEHEAVEEAADVYEATLATASRFRREIAGANETQFRENSEARKNAAGRDAAVAAYLTSRDAPTQSEAREAIDRYEEAKQRSAAETELALRERGRDLQQAMTVTYAEEDALESFLETGIPS